MKSKGAVIALLASLTAIGHSGSAFAEVCYEAGGTVTTENITSTLQMGSINLTLSEYGSTIFDEQGSLVGNITGAEGPGTVILSHKARFPQGDSFVTNGDKAIVVGLRTDEDGYPLVDEDGIPCSFLILETISEIAKGTRLFKNVTGVNIIANGYISNCPTENQNYFELSGELCVD